MEEPLSMSGQCFITSAIGSLSNDEEDDAK